MTNQEKAQNIKNKVSISKKILIIASQPADHDSIGTALVVKWWLQKSGKSDIRICAFYSIPDKFKDFPGIDSIESAYPDNVDFSIYDLIIMVDGGEFSRYFTNQYESHLARVDKEKLVNIDHHELGNVETLIPDYNLNAHDSCTAKVFYDYFLKDFESPLDSKVATWMYKALLWDTSNFKWGIFPGTFAFANVLIDLGVNHIEASNYNISKTELDFFIWATTNTEYYPEVRSTFLVLDNNKLTESEHLFGRNWDNQDVDRYYKDTFMKVVEGYDYYFLIKQKDEIVNISWRKRDWGTPIELRSLLRSFGFNGGGHISSGSSKSTLSIKDTQERIIQGIRNELRKF